MGSGNDLRARNSTFSRSAYNESCMGAYYTDTAHCEVLRELFCFPEEEVCVLEPSIGDGAAVKATTGAQTNPNIKIFGVELNQEVCQETKKDPFIEECINADFTNGVRIKNDAFTFCFGNPPYLDEDLDEGGRGRMERTFLEKVTQNYLKKGGIVVWVIPYRIFSELSYFRYLLNHYEFIGVWKFWPQEYAKWHQVVFVGRKIPPVFNLADKVTQEHKKYQTIDEVMELPKTFRGSSLYQAIEVEPSKADDITLFCTAVFDSNEAYELLSKIKDGDTDDAGKSLQDYDKLVSKRVTEKPFMASDLGKPPIPLKKDTLYLLSTAGAGQGVVGTMGEDLHLQRGVAEKKELVEYNENPEDTESSDVCKVTTYTAVSMTVIETDGRITVLE